MIAKKTIIVSLITLIGIGLAVWGGLALLEFLSWKTIRFSLSSQTKSMTLYNSAYASNDSDNSESPQQVGYREGSGTLRLKAGTYYAIPNGENVTNDAIKVSITPDTTEVKIDPYYSEEYLAQSFTSELPAINTAITQKYSNIIDQYTINTGTFYHFGNWYSTTLSKSSVEQGEGVDVYGIILHKENNTWSIAASPKIVFTYKDHKHIPADIIYAVNESINQF